MSFRLTIETDNAAFDDPERGGSGFDELVRLIRLAADRVDDGVREGVLLDINGHTVGQYYIDAPLPCEVPV